MTYQSGESTAGYLRDMTICQIAVRIGRLKTTVMRAYSGQGLMQRSGCYRQKARQAMSNVELKPCPFCLDVDYPTRSAPTLVRNIEGDSWIDCMNNECHFMPETSVFTTDEEAIKVWNTRPREKELQAEIERLEAENICLRSDLTKFLACEATVVDLEAQLEEAKNLLGMDNYLSDEPKLFEVTTATNTKPNWCNACNRPIGDAQ